MITANDLYDVINETKRACAPEIELLAIALYENAIRLGESAGLEILDDKGMVTKECLVLNAMLPDVEIHLYMALAVRFMGMNDANSK